MENINWLKAEDIKPVYDKLSWSRPESGQGAGKLLIIGGSSSGFAEPAATYEEAKKNYAGAIRILLPDNLRSTVQKLVDFEVFFAPSTKYGSFKNLALSEMLEHAMWADTVLFAGGIGRNSETSAVMEKFLSKHMGSVVLSGDCVEALLSTPEAMLMRQNTAVVCDLGQLQKMWPKLYKTIQPPTHSLPLHKVVELLAEATSQTEAVIITNFLENIIVSASGKTYSSKFSQKVWALKTSSHVAVWTMQNESKVFEATASAVYELTS